MTSQYPKPFEDARSPIPSSWALTFTDAVARYAQQLWALELKIPNAPQPVYNPETLTAEIRQEVRHLVTGFAQALKNPYTLQWSCKAYNSFVGGQDGSNERFERDLESLYPPLPDVYESRPACIVDKRGVIVLFYVPDALQSDRQAQIFMSMESLNPTLMKKTNGPHERGSWRQLNGYFRPDQPGLLSIPGLVTLGIRQNQGHEKPRRDMHIAGDLGSSGRLTAAHREARAWLPSALVFGALMSASLAITHPEQYALTRECLIRLSKEHPDLEAVLKIWPFAFNALAVVSNRATPMHRDRFSGDEEDYEGMASVGGDDQVVIQFQGLGFRGRYRSGTMVWTSCYMHLHSVCESPDAERVSFAGYVKQSVHLDTGLDPPRAPTLELIKEVLMRQM